MNRYPVIDTGFTVGVSPMMHYLAEEELFADMDRNGIDIQTIYQPDECFFHQTPDWNPYLGNDYIAKIKAICPERVLGLATLQMWHQPYTRKDQVRSRNIAGEELERAILDLHLDGIRVNPIQHNIAFNDRSIVWSMLEQLLALQNKTGRRMLVSVHAYGDSLYNSPEAIAETAARFPDLIFLMQHAGFVWGGFTVCDVAGSMQNVFLDLTTMPQYAILYKAYQRFGVGKFCIGTDGPYADWELKKAILNDFTKDQEEQGLILGGNLAKLLFAEKPDRNVVNYGQS